MYGSAISAGVSGCGPAVNLPVLTFCGKPAVYQLDPNIYELVQRHGHVAQRPKYPSTQDARLSSLLRKALGFGKGMRERMCSDCSSLVTSCRAQIAKRPLALNITVDKDGDSAVSNDEISDGAVPSAASGSAVTPRRRSRSARPYFIATPAPGSMFSGPALARSFQRAVSSPPRCTPPSNGVIHDPYRGGIEVHDVSCIPGSRGVRLIGLPRTRSVIT